MMGQLLLFSKVIGELSATLATSPMCLSPDGWEVCELSKASFWELAFVVKPVVRSTNTLMSPDPPCLANA